MNSINIYSKIILNLAHLNTKVLVSFYLFFVVIPLQCVIAQPSGGPYGPIVKSYEVPKITGRIFYVSADGKREQSGKDLQTPTTIESAIEQAKSGDAIILRGGTYRTGNLVFNQSITIQPYQNEQPIFKGTLAASNWKNLGSGLWTTKWSHLFPTKPADWWQRDREGKKTPLHRFNNDMVFVDGKFLQSAGWEGEVTKDTYYIDYESGLVYIGIDPTNKLVEITAYDCALLRTIKDYNGKTSDRKGPIIRGITFTQYAYRAIEIEGIEPEGLSPEANHGKDVIGTELENCTISYCSRVAGYFRGDRLKIRNCKISDTSTEGIYVIGSADVLLEKNIFMRNNIERITGYYPAAVKIFNQSYRVTCNDNLVIDQPYSNGIWYDVGNVDGVFTNNWIEGVGNNKRDYAKNQLWPSDNGFFFEISKGAICSGNVFVNCDHGLMVLNSSNVKIYQNTFVNSMACIGRNTRSAAGDHFGWHPSTGPDVNDRDGHIFENNLLVGDENLNRPLMFVWQPAVLCKQVSNSQLQQFDYNMFVRSTQSLQPLVLWSPAGNDNCQININTLDELNKLYTGFMVHSKYFDNYSGPLFKSNELGDYHLLKSFPGANEAIKLPEDIGKFLEISKKYIGAYPPVN